MEAKGEISMRMVHCEDCGKRYDYDVDGFCPRCGAFNQPVWVRSGGPPRPLSPLRHSRSGQGGSSGNWEKISVRQRWPWAGC